MRRYTDRTMLTVKLACTLLMIAKSRMEAAAIGKHNISSRNCNMPTDLATNLAIHFLDHIHNEACNKNFTCQSDAVDQTDPVVAGQGSAEQSGEAIVLMAARKAAGLELVTSTPQSGAYGPAYGPAYDPAYDPENELSDYDEILLDQPESHVSPTSTDMADTSPGNQSPGEIFHPTGTASNSKTSSATRVYTPGVNTIDTTGRHSESPVSTTPSQATTGRQSERPASTTPSQATTGRQSEGPASTTPSQATTGHQSEGPASTTPSQATTGPQSESPASTTPSQATTGRQSESPASTTPSQATTGRQSESPASTTPPMTTTGRQSQDSSSSTPSLTNTVSETESQTHQSTAPDERLSEHETGGADDSNILQHGPDSPSIQPVFDSVYLTELEVGVDLETRAMCTWHYELDVDPSRYPVNLVQAVCAGNPQYLGNGTSLVGCEPVYMTITVLRRSRDDCDPVSWELKYVSTQQQLAVGCVSAVRYASA